MPKIAIDLSGSGGLVKNSQLTLPYSSPQANLKYVGKDNQYVNGVVNPMALDGFMSPTNDTTTDIQVAGVAVPCLISSYTVNPSSSFSTVREIYLGEYNTDATTDSRILKLTSHTDLSLEVETTVTDGVMYPMIVDMIQYMVNGTQSMFYALAAKDSGSSSTMGQTATWTSYDHDWLDNIPAGDSYIGRNFDTRLIVADNSFMYILESEHVWKLDGTNTSGGGNATLTDALTVDNAAGDVEWMDAIDTRGRMWIGMHYFGNRPFKKSPSYVREDFVGEINDQAIIGVYIWDRQTTIFSMQDFIPIQGAQDFRTIHDLNGIPVVFTVGFDRLTQLRAWNGADFGIVELLPEDAYPRFHSSVYVSSLGMWWIGWNGIIYYYGKLNPGQELNELYKMGDMTGHVTSGKTLNGTGILVPWGGVDSVTSGYNTTNLAFLISISDDGGNYFLKKWYPHAYDPVDTDQKSHTGTVYSKVQLIPKLSNARGVTVHFPAIGSGGSTKLLDVSIYFNLSSTVFKTVTLTKNDLKNGFAWIPTAKKNVNAVQLGLTWKNENIALNITPYMAVLDYEPVDKKK